MGSSRGDDVWKEKEYEFILEGFEEDSTLYLEGQMGHRREISLF